MDGLLDTLLVSASLGTESRIVAFEFRLKLKYPHKLQDRTATRMEMLEMTIHDTMLLAAVHYPLRPSLEVSRRPL
jgi:hypothetical protein